MSIINQTQDIHGKKLFIPKRGSVKPTRTKKLPLHQEESAEDLNKTPKKVSSRQEIMRNDSGETMPYHSFIGGAITEIEQSPAKVNPPPIRQIKDIKFLKED